MRNLLVHKLNALHVYCRLVDMGIRKAWAFRLARTYEKFFFYRVLYRNTA